jgi:hypothetical protein
MGKKNGTCNTCGSNNMSFQSEYARPRQRLEDIKMGIRQLRCEGVDWIHLAQSSQNCIAPSGSIKKKGDSGPHSTMYCK